MGERQVVREEGSALVELDDAPSCVRLLRRCAYREACQRRYGRVDLWLWHWLRGHPDAAGSPKQYEPYKRAFLVGLVQGRAGAEKVIGGGAGATGSE